MEISSSEFLKLPKKLFESREKAHVFHLQTKSFAVHKATEDYYNSILDFVDDLVEIWQGQYGITSNEYEMSENSESDPIKYFEDLASFIKEQRSKSISEKDTHLHNIVDEVVALVYKTIYKLKNLK